jgi:hypothetical protein
MEQPKKNPIDYMRVMVFIALFLLSICCGALQCQASESEKFSALIIDNSSVQMFVYDLYLGKRAEWWSPHEIIKKDILIKVV